MKKSTAVGPRSLYTKRLCKIPTVFRFRAVPNESRVSHRLRSGAWIGKASVIHVEADAILGNAKSNLGKAVSNNSSEFFSMSQSSHSAVPQLLRRRPVANNSKSGGRSGPDE